jgi:ribosomal protein S18 acetylase RimI-like enzyme
MELKLKPFANTHAYEVLSWVSSQQEQLLWCGTTDFPLESNIFEKWHAEDYVTPYVLLRNDEPVAYGELWTDEEEVELARLIVRPGFRGMGHGQELVNQLTNMAVLSGRQEVYMRVFPENTAALKCYAKAGFERLPQEQQETFNKHQPHRYEWLLIRK